MAPARRIIFSALLGLGCGTQPPDSGEVEEAVRAHEDDPWAAFSVPDGPAASGSDFPSFGADAQWVRAHSTDADGSLVSEFWVLHPPPAFVAEVLTEPQLRACRALLDGGAPFCEVVDQWPCAGIRIRDSGNVELTVSPDCIRDGASDARVGQGARGWFMGPEATAASR